jgi:molecular chaperone GrpE
MSEQQMHEQESNLSVLANLGFPRRDDTGKAFDPALHEAVGTIADEELVRAR